MSALRRTMAVRAGLALVVAQFAAGNAAAAGTGYRVYVTNEGSGDVTVIDGASRAVVGTYPLGKRPRGIVASPDGRLLYVALSGSPLGGPGVDESKLPPADKSADGIGVLDARTGRVLRTLTGVSDPEQLAVSGDGSRLFVASEDTGRAVIQRASDGVAIGSVDVGGEPEGVAASGPAGLVGVTSEADSTVSLVDARSGALVATLAAGQRPRDLVFSRDGTRLFVSGENDGSVTVIDVPARKVLRSTRLAGELLRPKGLALSPDGRRLYVSTGRGRQVLALDASTLAVLGSATVGARPWGIALSPDGGTLYAANGPSNDLSVIDTADMRVLAVLPVGERPWGVAIVPDAPVDGPTASAAPAYRISRQVVLGAPDHWDYVTFDEGTHQVFVAHGDRVTVVDGRDGRIVGNLPGMPGGTHGFAVANGRGYTDDGGEGAIVSFDLATLARVSRIAGEKDADGMLFEPVTGQLYVVDADPGHLTVVDPKAGKVAATIEAGAALEFLVADGEGKVYVNGAARNEIVRVDARTRRIDARWPMPGCTSPRGLAIDRSNRRLFSSCGNGVLVVLDALDGRVVAKLPIGQGTDAAAFDPKRQLVYSSNGRDGTITVIRQLDPAHYAVVATIATAVTGRTMGIDPASGRLYVAAADVQPGATPGQQRLPVVPGSLKLLFIDPVD